MSPMSPELMIPAVAVAALFAIALIYAVLYKKVPRGIALVRTGLNGRKVVIDGGCLRLPVFHELRPVNLSTVQLTVHRHGEDALITKDSLRVDATVDFYVSVREDHDAVAQAARTLGERTFEADRLREMVEGKLVDALRAVAATQKMLALHENRQEFVQEVQSIVANDLAKNGLQLEAVSLTGLDQTPTDNLDPNNTFNATALKMIAELVAEQTEKRAEAEANAKIAEEREAARAEEETIRNRERVERSEIDKKRSVEIYRSESDAESQKADIAAKRQAEQAELEKEEDLRSREITRDRNLKVSEQESRKAEIAAQQEAERAELEKDEALRARQIERDRNLEISEQEQRIAVAEKSESESQAQAKAEEARKARIVAEQAVQTAQERAAAERAKQVATLKAEEEAQVEATQIRVSAEARRAEAEEQAKARRNAAEQEAMARRNAAEKDREAAEFEAQGEREKRQAEADGIRALNDAKNTLDGRLIAFDERLKELEVAPEVVRELVQPFHGVGQNMRSVFVHGLGGNSSANDQGGGASGQGGSSRSVIDELFGQIMNYSVSQPALKQIGESIGIDLQEALRTGSLTKANDQEQQDAVSTATTPLAGADPSSVDGDDTEQSAAIH